MLSSTSTTRSNLLWLAGLGVTGAIGYVIYPALVQFAKQDPLASMRNLSSSDLPSTVGVQLQTVKLTHFDGAKVVSTCNVNQIDIQQNRVVYDLSGVKDGEFYSKKGAFKFAANVGNWNGYSQTLSCQGQVKVSNADLDLSSQAFVFDNRARVLKVPTEISGTAYKGQLKLADLNYSLDTDDLESSLASWQGQPPKEVQKELPVATRSVWDVQMKQFKVKGDVWEGSDGTMKDGDIIVRAPNAMTYDRKNEIVTATGSVMYYSSKVNMLADKVVVYRKEKRAILIGNVQMLVKPKKDADKPVVQEVIPPFKPLVPDEVAANRPPDPNKDQLKKQADQVRDGKTARDYPMVVTAGQIEYWYRKGERRAKITGSPQGRQELPENQWRHMWAFSAFYDGEKERLKLESAKDKSDARMKNSIGDDLLAKWFDISTKEGDDDYEASEMRGTITDTSDEDERPDGGKKKPGGGTDPGKVPPPLQGPIGGPLNTDPRLKKPTKA